MPDKSAAFGLKAIRTNTRNHSAFASAPGMKVVRSIRKKWRHQLRKPITKQPLDKCWGVSRNRHSTGSSPSESSSEFLARGGCWSPGPRLSGSLVLAEASPRLLGQLSAGANLGLLCPERRQLRNRRSRRLGSKIYPLSHEMRVLIAEVTIGLHAQCAAIAMTEPA